MHKVLHPQKHAVQMLHFTRPAAARHSQRSRAVREDQGLEVLAEDPAEVLQADFVSPWYSDSPVLNAGWPCVAE